MRDVLREVRQMRKILEAEGDAFDRLEYYENPERILASFKEAKKRYGKPTRR